MSRLFQLKNQDAGSIPIILCMNSLLKVRLFLLLVSTNLNTMHGEQGLDADASRDLSILSFFDSTNDFIVSTCTGTERTMTITNGHHSSYTMTGPDGACNESPPPPQPYGPTTTLQALLAQP